MRYLFQTNHDYVCLFLRVIAGVIIFPYGMQKLFGWFDDFGGGVGIKGSLARLRARKVPASLGWLIILGQSIGSVALMLGFMGRVAAGVNFIIFMGALLVHVGDGWTLNWEGKKKGEGIEYFVLLLAVLLVIVVRGSGAVSVDRWIVS